MGTQKLEMENERLEEGIQMVEGEKEHLEVDLKHQEKDRN